MTKQELRKNIRLLRQEFVSKPLFWNEINPKHFTTPLAPYLGGGCVVAGYVAIGSETPVTNILEWAVVGGCRIALPYIANRDSQIEFRRWIPGEELGVAPFGFQQPLPGSATTSPDIILTPLIGFDRALNRLGQGAGHYDRAFARWPSALRIGIAWSVQEIACIPTDPWDLPLDAVLTQREWIIGPTGRIQ